MQVLKDKMTFPVYFDSKKSLHLFNFFDNFELLKNLYIKKKFPKVLMLTGIKGSGKSTLIDILLGFKEISSGSVQVFYGKKQNVLKESYKLYNEVSLAYLPQNVSIFTDTLEENIYIGRKKNSSKEIEDISKLLNFKYGINNLLETACWSFIRQE